MPLTVHALLCHRDVRLGSVCLASLLAQCADPIRLHIHDDGSLQPDDVCLLSDQLRPYRFWSAQDRDDHVLPRLSRHPACRLFRERHKLAPKLIDMPLLADDAYAYVDTDVYFRRPFRGLDRRGTGERLVYMTDNESTYSMSNYERRIGLCRIRLPERVNTGLMFVSVGTFDLDLTEWFLSESRYRIDSWHAEQTCWALHAARKGGRSWDPVQIVTPERRTPTSAIAIHCYAWYKNQIDCFREESTSNPEHLLLQTVPPKYESLLRLGSRRAWLRAKAKFVL